MNLRDATLQALYDIDGSGPYRGVTFAQITDRISQGLAAAQLFDPFPQLGLLSRVIDGLVENGFVEDLYEERKGFEGVETVARIRTYRLAPAAYRPPSDP